MLLHDQVTHAEVEQVIALTGMKMKEGSLVVEVVEGTGMVESRGESVGPDVGEARIGDVNQETSVDMRKTTIDVDKENNVRKTRTVDANNWRNVTTQDKRLAPLLCRQCHQRFGDAKNEKVRSAFNAHIWEPHDFACRYCKYIKFTSADELDEHVARACRASQPMEGWSIYKGKSYNCNFCRLKFKRKRVLGEHQARPHTVPCELCQLKFTNEAFLEEHMDTAHETEERSTDDTVEEESVTTLVGEGRKKQSKKKPNYFLNESDDEESDGDDEGGDSEAVGGSGSPGSSIVSPPLVGSFNQHDMGNQGMPAAIDLTQDNDTDLAEEDVTLGERHWRIRNRADLSEITEDFCEEPVEQDGDDQTDASQQLLAGANGGDKEPPRKRAKMGGEKRAIAEGEEGSAVSEEEEGVCRGQRRSRRRNSPGLTKGYFKGMDMGLLARLSRGWTWASWPYY